MISKVFSFFFRKKIFRPRLGAAEATARVICLDARLKPIWFAAFPDIGLSTSSTTAISIDATIEALCDD